EPARQRTAHRAVRQDPAAGGRPRGRPRRSSGHRAVRRARARPRARPHLPRHPAGAVERARRGPRRRAGRGRPRAVQPLRGAAGAAGRRRRHDGALRAPAADELPDPRPGDAVHRPRRARGGPAEQEDHPDARGPHRRRHRRGAPLGARAAQAGAAQDRLARRGPRGLRRRRGPPDQPRPDRLGAARLPGRRRRGLLARRLGRGRAALRRRQDAGRRRGDGAGRGDDADPRHQHGGRPAVEARADRAHVADRGGDRRVLRRAQGDPPRHHRDLPGDDPQDQGRVPGAGAVRLPRLGPDHLRRGAPAPRARLPHDERPPVAPPPRAHRDAGPRGRPRGRRLLAHRAQALRRAVARHRGPGLDRARRLRRGPRDHDRQRADHLRHRRGRGALPALRLRAHEDPGGQEHPRAPPRRARAGHRGLPRPARRARRRPRRARHPGLDEEQGARGAVRPVPARGDPRAGRVEGRELLHRPARRLGRDPGVRDLRLAPGGGPAPRPHPAAQGRRAPGALLLRRGPRLGRRRVRRPPPALPRRAGLRLPDRRRRRPPRPGDPGRRERGRAGVGAARPLEL
ncbi:MAG: DNA repair helicase, partial [uncultured Actinomycetospora sp.]